MPTGPAEFPRAADLARGDLPENCGVKLEPYWWEAAPRRDAPTTDLPRETEVAIVGSGFTGLSAALTLLRRGRQALVLERGVPGYGASTRNGGQIGSGNQKLYLAHHDRETMLALLHEGMRIFAHIEHVIATERIECHFVRCGRFRGAVRPEHYEAMARDSEELRKAVGLESIMVPRAEVRQEVGTDVFHGAMVLPNDAALHPGLYHAGLMQRVEEAGGRVAGRAGVTAIARRGKDFVLATAAGEVRCRDVIVATDGHTDGLVPDLRPRIVAIGSAMIATAPIPDDLFARLLPKNRVYGTTNRVFSYFRGAPAERRILWGGRVSRFRPATSPQAFRHLAQDMLRFFPELKDVPVTHAWDGLIGQTLDYVPHIGRTGQGVHFAMGYCGNSGVARGTYLGHKVALKVLGDPDGRTAFDGLVFPRFPLHPLVSRAIPGIEAWMSLRDRLNV